MSGWHTDNNEIRIVKIQNIRVETPRVKTYFFKDKLCSIAEPGQFIMAWVPGVDEIPLSLSTIGEELSSITVKEVGEGTRALSVMKQGDLIGVRGPFGSHFKISGTKTLMIGGGIGIAPLIMLIMKIVGENVKTTIIEGAKTRDELIFFSQLRALSAKAGVNVVFTTEDGSYGVRGLVTDALERSLSSERFDSLYTCGNEMMICKVISLSKKYRVPLQASLERIMLCGLGICGSCVIGKYRVCKDGPVFDNVQLKEVENELGQFTRDFKGEHIQIKAKGS